jgi:hypothetical protein
MTRYHNTSKGEIPFTPEEEAARDIEEANYLTDAATTIHEQIDLNTDNLILCQEFNYPPETETYIFNTKGRADYLDEYSTMEDGDYPYNLKAKGDNYYQAPNRTAHWDFIRYGAGVIKRLITWGRVLKYGGEFEGVIYTALTDMTIEELCNFTDPRL